MLPTLVAVVWLAAPTGETVEVFSKKGCPHCERAAAFLDQLETARPELTVIRRDVADPDDLERLRSIADEADAPGPLAVPAIWIRGRLWVGFDSAETTGAEIEAWIDARAGPGPTRPRDRDVDLPLFGRTSAGDLGLPLFTIVIGLIDGFNPCAMWVLLFLLSILVNLHDRKKMALIAGTFVAVSGVAYFAFMAAWLNLFVIVGLTRGVQVTLGLIAVAMASVHIKDFFAFGKGPSLSIPEAAKPGIYRRVRKVLRAEHTAAALGGVIVLAVMVNLVELLCTAGLPAVYTQILTAHDLPGWKYYLYLALYNAAYLADDALMVTIGVVTLSRHKLQERGGRVLKLVSGLVMLVLGLILLLAPDLLLWG